MHFVHNAILNIFIHFYFSGGMVMFTILSHLKNRYLSQKAQGIVEYALILAFVVAVAAALLSGGNLAEAITGVFDKTTDAVNRPTATE